MIRLLTQLHRAIAVITCPNNIKKKNGGPLRKKGIGIF